MNLKENIINSLSGEDIEITPVISVTQVGIVEVMEKTDLCSGMACLRCELSCPEKVFKYGEFLTEKEREVS